MTMMLPRLAARLFGVPLMVDAGKAAAALAAVGGRFVPGGVTLEGVEPLHHVAFATGRPSMGTLGDPTGSRYEMAGEGARLVPRTASGVGIVAIEGTLVHKGGWIGMNSGETSYQGLQAQVMRARRDPGIRAVVFEVDSAGGEVSGAFETAAMIADLSREKPTIAIMTDVALSAGYLLASACRQIVAPANGMAGSIGVISLHVDQSARDEAEGYAVTLLYSGKHKADFNPFEPLADDVAARWRAKLDGLRDQFASAVSASRGARLTKKAALATEAETYAGEDARSAGLIDAVGHPYEAFSAFVAAIEKGR